MVLNSNTIKALMRGDLAAEQIQQVGVDLTVKGIGKVNGGSIMCDQTILKPYSKINSQITPVTRKDGKQTMANVYHLHPGHYSVQFNEGIDIPKDSMALVIHRSSLLRSGGILISALWDPGFSTDNMGSFMSLNEYIRIEQDARIAQVFFIKSEEVPEELLYNGQWQGK